MNELIEKITTELKYFGYEINEIEFQENQGALLTKITFNSNPLTLTVYKKRRKGNTVVQGNGSDFDKRVITDIVEKTKWNLFTNKELEKEVLSLILTKKEGELYDFKEMWSKSNSDLLHDILCLANNRENKTAYLIIGVADDFSIPGLEEHRDHDEVYSWFRQINFACSQYPKIEVHKLNIIDRKVDILEISPDSNTPYYLDEDYCHSGKPVKKYHIYTRYGDTNTPKSEQANKNDIQKLWSFRNNIE